MFTVRYGLISYIKQITFRLSNFNKSASKMSFSFCKEFVYTVISVIHLIL